MTARLISDRDLQLLRRYDKKDADYQAKLLEEVGRECWAAGAWGLAKEGHGCRCHRRNRRPRCLPPLLDSRSWATSCCAGGPLLR